MIFSFTMIVSFWIPKSSSAINYSMLILSGPVDFPCLVRFIAFLTSSVSIGGPSSVFLRV